MRLLEPVREFQFHRTRKWRVDFAWPALRLAVEIQGGIWRQGGGAHSRPQNILRDMAKANALTECAWRVLYFTPDECKSGAAAQRVDAFMRTLPGYAQAVAAARSVEDYPPRAADRPPSLPHGGNHG
jgi:very-short-patch-repair endonuclease